MHTGSSMRVLIAVMLFVVGSCSGHDNSMDDMRAREVAHHTAMVNAADLEAARAETADYVADMMGMMGMMDDCHMADEMAAAMAAHMEAVEMATDMDAMMVECETHHADMMRMMDDGHGMGM